MSKIPKIVAFDRPAAYLYHRAMLNRRDRRSVDALELLRRAVESSPDNRAYRQDLAHLYYEMGCYEQSSRLLLDMLSEKDAPTECLYDLAQSQAGLGDLSGARQALDLFTRREPEASKAKDVIEFYESMDNYESAYQPADRRQYRAMCIANRACEALKGDMPKRACRLFEASLRLNPDQVEMRALYAMALYMAGDVEGARAHAEEVCDGDPPSVRALSVCAQVYDLMGERDVSERLMDAVMREYPREFDLRLVLYAVTEMEMHDRVADCTRMALVDAPYEREILHMRAVALKRLGAPDEEVARCWDRILRIDPEDSVARYYSDAAARRGLDDISLDYGYQVPAEEYTRRARALADALMEGFEHIRARWTEDRDFRCLARWGVSAGSAELARAAVTILATVNDAAARSMLRQLLMLPRIPHELKLHAVLIARLQGVPMEEILPVVSENAGATLVDVEALLHDMPVGERQLVRYADEVLQRDYGIHALSALALLWDGYRRFRGTRADPLKSIRPAAAGLALYYLMDTGRIPDIGELSKQFECEVRQIAFCAKRIVKSMDKQRGIQE